MHLERKNCEVIKTILCVKCNPLKQKSMFYSVDLASLALCWVFKKSQKKATKSVWRFEKGFGNHRGTVLKLNRKENSLSGDFVWFYFLPLDIAKSDAFPSVKP